MIAPAEHSIVISPSGDCDADIFDAITRDIQRVFGYRTEIMPLLESLDFAYDGNRAQYHSSKILKALAEKAPGQAVKVLAITGVDLFIPILTYVFGEAQIGGRSCIISTHRLIFSTGLLVSCEKRGRKCSANSGRSSLCSLSGGISKETTFRR